MWMANATGDVWRVMITFLDEYRKPTPIPRRARDAYLEPTSHAEDMLAERWAAAETLMRLFDLNWSQAIGIASRIAESRGQDPRPAAGEVGDGNDWYSLPGGRGDRASGF